MCRPARDSSLDQNGHCTGYQTKCSKFQRRLATRSGHGFALTSPQKITYARTPNAQMSVSLPPYLSPRRTSGEAKLVIAMSGSALFLVTWLVFKEDSLQGARKGIEVWLAFLDIRC